MDWNAIYEKPLAQFPLQGNYKNIVFDLHALVREISDISPRTIKPKDVIVTPSGIWTASTATHLTLQDRSITRSLDSWKISNVTNSDTWNKSIVTSSSTWKVSAVCYDLEESEIIDILLGKSIRCDVRQWSSKSRQLILKAYYKACTRMSMDIKQIFIENQIPTDINIKFSKKFVKNFKPLYFAIKYQLSDVITILIENGIDIEAADAKGMTPLHFAVQNTQMGLLEEDQFIIWQLDSDFYDCDLFSHRLLNAIDLLLKHGCDINAKDSFGRTPIFYLHNRLSEVASSHYTPVDHSRLGSLHRNTIHRLLSLSPTLDVADDKGHTILHLLAKAGNVFWNFSDNELVEAYLKSGGNINALNHRGFTALHYACDKDFPELVDVLLKNGADANLSRCGETERPIHRAVRFAVQNQHRCTEGKFRVVEMLLKHGAHVDAATTDGTTPILLASVTPRHLDAGANNLLMTCLLNWGCDLECRDSRGWTPLHNVCAEENWLMMDVMLKRGADMNAADLRGRTPMHLIYHEAPLSTAAIVLVPVHFARLMILGAPNFDSGHEFYLMADEEDTAVCRNECLAQLEFMKTVEVDSSNSLYDVLHRDVEYLSRRVRNERLMEILCSPYFDEDYSMYGYLVKAKIMGARKRAALLESAKEALFRIASVGLNACFDEILRHLDASDLTKLIEVGNCYGC